MKTTTTKLCALALAMLMLISCVLTVATATQPFVYSKDSNSGTRGELCISLEGTSASSGW